MKNDPHKNFQVIVTIGAALLSNAGKLREIDACGDCIYRINGAHVDAEKLSIFMNKLRTMLPNPKIMIDLPGNKIRTRDLSDPICLNKNEKFKLYDYQVNYSKFFDYLKVGDIILANDSTLTLEIKEVNDSCLEILSHSNGWLENNKGLHKPGIHKDIPFLFQKDMELIKVACAENVDYISLSYVRTSADIKEAKKVIAQDQGKAIQLIAKIETALAVKNLGAIFEEIERVNIDRGDLSTDVGLLNLPAIQAYIVNSALAAGKSIFLATQFLKNMENNPVPLISEIVDLYRTMRSGITGIQLSEETAIGKYPVECVKLVFDVFDKLVPTGEWGRDKLADLNLKYAGEVNALKR